MRQPRLIVMVKEPRPGRVKTRLGRDIGMTSAAWWFRHQARGLLRRVEDRRWQTLLAVSPDAEGLQSRIWPNHLLRIAQGSGNLGARMGRLFHTLPMGPVVIIGADIPGISRAHIARAFAALGNHASVLGPAPDGGFWLIGLKRVSPPPKTLFYGVRWSTAQTMTDTLATLPRPIAMIDTLNDIDTAADLANDLE